MRTAALLLVAACSSKGTPAPSTIEPVPAPAPPAASAVPAQLPSSIVLPGGGGGIGFDDLRFSPELHRVLAPAGGTGKLDLIDPTTGAIESIDGFSITAGTHGHGDGTTSVDAGPHVLFAIDRGTLEVSVIDPAAKKIVTSAKLAASPDYVRWVAPTKEVWVTEPRTAEIEYFAFDGTTLVRKGAFKVAGGPESLAIDATRHRAYTHTWKDATVAIDLSTHAEVARWKNGCAESRGIALDEPRGLVFVGCEEGQATAIDVVHDGKVVGTVATGKGVDIIAYDPGRGHLYVPGGDSATLTIVGVAGSGALSALETVPAAEDSHCVTVDDSGHAYVCDPKHGALIVVTDHAHS